MLLWASLLFGIARAEVADRVAAVVNDDVITLSEVYELGSDFIEERAAFAQGSAQVRRETEIEVLDSLIMRRLISQEIELLALDVTDQELDRTIDDIASRNGMDRDRLRKEVETSGLSWAQYRQELKENLRQMKFSQAVIRPRINVNEDELKDAYRRTVTDAPRPRVAELGALFLPFDRTITEPEAKKAHEAEVTAKAQAAAARVQGGEDFAAVAAEVDQGPYGKAGGRLGTYRKGELMPTLDEAAFALADMGTSGPVVTAQGVYILHVFSSRDEEAPSYEAMRERLLDQVYSDRIEDETDQWYRQARRKAAVIVKLEPLDAAQ